MSTKKQKIEVHFASDKQNSLTIVETQEKKYK